MRAPRRFAPSACPAPLARSSFRTGTNTIGRSEQATVRIDSRDVSRIHANLTVTESGAMLENLGSNGTVVNGTLMKGALALTDGDRVAIADIEFLVEVLRMETNQ